MLNKATALATVLGAILLVAGHAEARDRKFSCPMDKGVTCMTPENVYMATNHVDFLVPEETGRRANVRKGKQAPQPVGFVQAPLPAPVPHAYSVNVSGQPVPTPDRCCDPVATAVTVKGDTLAVSSPVLTQAVAAPAPAQVVASTVSSTAPNVTIPGGGGETVLRTTNNEAFRSPARVMRILVHPWVDDSGDLNMGGFVLTEIEPRRWSVGARVNSTDDGFRLLMSSPVRETAQDARTATGSATPGTGRPERGVASTNSPETKQ